MAKKRNHMSDLPKMQRIEPGMEVVLATGETIEPVTTDTAPIKVDCEVEARAVSLNGKAVQLATIDIPYVLISNSNGGYQDEVRRCDLGVLSKEHARKLRAIRRGFDFSGVRFQGRDVESLPNAVKALLDMLDI